MLRRVCTALCQSKNLLMLLTVGIYILALYSMLSSQALLFSLIITSAALYAVIKELFPLKYIIIWCLVFYFGMVNTAIRLKDTDGLLNFAPVNSKIAGTIISIPQGMSENKPRFFFKVKSIEFGSVKKEFKNEKVLVTYTPDFNNSLNYDGLKLYNTCILEGRLSPPFKAGNPSQFDYGNYLRNYDAYTVFYAKNYEVLDSNPTKFQKFMQGVNKYRERIISSHSKYLKTPNLEILGGIVFGDDAVSPPQNIKQSFINSGLLHILAASGMNVAFIFSFFYYLMSVFGINYKVKVCSGIITVLIYSLMTGLGASVIRAACMLVFVLIGKLIDRDAHSISLLSFVAFLMLLYNPMYINDVGFQLSFIVTFGLLVMVPLFEKTGNRIVNFGISTICIPVIAQLWVIPIQIFYFSNISIYSVFANIMSVPILMILSFGGFISSLLAAIPPISDFVCKTFDIILNPLLTFLVNISDFWGKLPHSTLQTTHPSVFQIILYYGILLCLAGILSKEFKEKRIVKIALLVLLIILSLTFIPVKNKNLEITAFDVGNADCFLIKTPEDDYLMIDTGRSGYRGGKSQAEIIVLKYLNDRGIKKINSLILTHFDNDHCGGAVSLLDEGKSGIKVSRVFVNSLNHNSKSAEVIYKAAQRANVELIKAKDNEAVYNKSGVNIINYVPESLYDGDNGNSILTYIEYKGFRMLFTGDAGAKEILEHKEIPAPVNVLKVPHHGAAGGVNKSLIEKFKPEYVIISVGENKFGHPDAYTLKLLKDSVILRTDMDNAIRIKVNNKGYKLFCYDIKKRKFVKYKN